MSKLKDHGCYYCHWHGSDDDPIMRFFDHEPPYCLLGTNCRERQQANRDRQDPPSDYATGQTGAAS